MSDSGQKFIARNRAPRVQIEYDVEAYGSQKKVELPFVMGVISDLSGKGNENLPPLEERKFLEIDIDNFDDRLKSSQPKVSFNVPNTLSEEGGMLPVSIQFQSMDDFSPDAVAESIPSLNELLKIRKQLANLMTYMDGKANAEELLSKALKDKSLLNALMSAPKPEQEQEQEQGGES